MTVADAQGFLDAKMAAAEIAALFDSWEGPRTGPAADALLAFVATIPQDRGCFAGPYTVQADPLGVNRTSVLSLYTDHGICFAGWEMDGEMYWLSPDAEDEINPPVESEPVAPEPERWQCHGCGEYFPARSPLRHAIPWDGSPEDRPFDVTTCGPIQPRYAAMHGYTGD